MKENYWFSLEKIHTYAHAHKLLRSPWRGRGGGVWGGGGAGVCVVP